MWTFIIFTVFGLVVAADWDMFTSDPKETKAEARWGKLAVILCAVGYGAWCALV